jgi:hypothetical protein
VHNRQFSRPRESNLKNNLPNTLPQFELQSGTDAVAARQQRAGDNDCQSLTESDAAHTAELHEISNAWHLLPAYAQTAILGLIRAFPSKD